MRNNDGEVCSRGAIRRVAARHLNDLGVAAKADKALLETVHEIYPGIGSIERINDRADRQHMLDLCDKAIIKLEEHGQ